VDLLGNGTACLVWSSALPRDVLRPLRYIDLMGGTKPHLLVSVRNNLGAETRFQYAPSTKFYLDDLKAGEPWITKLPFPVHVVVRVETFDHISGSRFVSLYSYHHGHYDGAEQEFRGFGRVDQTDTESYAAFQGKGLFAPGTNSQEEGLHMPPVRTRTWFHTGAFLDGEKISAQFAHEYYGGDVSPQAAPLPDTVLPIGLTTPERIEACRALKGQILRQEIYAIDGSDKEPHPYSVSERNYHVTLIQPFGKNPHARGQRIRAGHALGGHRVRPPSGVERERPSPRRADSDLCHVHGSGRDQSDRHFNGLSRSAAGRDAHV
jgi:hypothetical protein